MRNFIGIIIFFAPLPIAFFFGGWISVGITTMVCIATWFPIVAIIMNWGMVPATCRFCGKENVSYMFQNGVGCIYHCCKKHLKHAQLEAERITFVGRAR